MKKLSKKGLDELDKKSTVRDIININHIRMAIEGLRYYANSFDNIIVNEIRDAKKRNVKIMSLGIPQEYQNYYMEKNKIKAKSIDTLYGIKVKKTKKFCITTEISLLKRITI